MVMIDCNEYTDWSAEWARDGGLKELPTVTAFLLVQGDKVLDVCNDPAKLDYDMIDEFADWGVYAGARNEFGACEVVGPVAKVWCTSAYSKYTMQTVYRDVDNSASFTATTLPSEVIRDELHRLHKMRALIDPCQLGWVKLFAS